LAALVITIAFRYIPHIASLYQAVSDAHRLRRPSPAGGGRRKGWLGRLRERISRIFPTLVSVTIHAIKTIPALSMTLETRGFGRPEKRSSFAALPSLSSRAGDLSAAALIVLLVLLPLVLQAT
jgi:energy-coupling factor transporter transmembrane protein EcfT